jgi:hypothetical protein
LPAEALRHLFKHFLLHIITILMKKHNKLLAGSLVLALGGGAYVGYAKFHDVKDEQAHHREVQTLVGHFRSCPDLYRRTGECHTPEERTRLLSQAQEQRGEGRFEEAGLTFARLGGMESDAREMAGRCALSGNTAGRDRILRELGLRSEAASAFSRQ